MKKLALLCFFLCVICTLSAQRLIISKDRSGLYTNHIVKPKETLYSLGRVYGLSHKDIATVNKLAPDALLVIGQEIKIPLKKENFNQSGSKRDYQPVYHTIKSGDNLYRLSKDYNNVKESLLKKWNGMSKNVVHPGQQVIVGYVMVNKNIEADETTAPGIGEDEKVVPLTDSTYQPVKQRQPGNIDTLTFTHNGDLEGEEGYYAGYYSVNGLSQQKTITGMAATFKSTSGWSDKKFYVLMNDVAIDAIVKITVNGKSIYAKVLEEMPGIKENHGIVCRLSNAAAAALGMTDPKFPVEISFYQ
jgi:LysM repeat protein